MITATAAMAIRANATRIVKFGLIMNEPMAEGARLTIPAKMMKPIPLPMPRSVISSPIHISATAPAVRVASWVSRPAKLARSNVPVSTFCELSSARKP